MSYKFNLADTDGFFYSQENKECSVLLPNNLGYIDTHREIIHDDISLFKGELHCSSDISMSSEFLARSLCIHITLQGETTFYDLLSKKETKYTANNISIGYVNGVSGITDIKKDIGRKVLTITVKDDFLQEHFFANIKDEERMIIEKNYNENITTNLKSAVSSAKTLFLANEIYNSPFIGSLNSLYLQGKVYEILHNEFTSLVQNQKYIPQKHKMKFSQEDIKALHKAKAIIIKDKMNISIPQLARKVAINEGKLKYGFKQLFDTTPGTIMLEERMYEAKKLLQRSELNATEISILVGYKHVQNFTIAFVKYFGVKPSDLMKKRKYYL